MEAEDPLSELADIHLPDAVTFWPPAPGWWLLAALILAALGWLLWQQYRLWQRRQRMKSALAALKVVHDNYNNRGAEIPANEAGLSFLYGCNEVLKRVALEHFPVLEVASLTGTPWLMFLDSHATEKGFCNGPAQVLGDGSYRPRFDADVEAVYQLCADWITTQYRRLDDKQNAQSPEATGVTA